MTLHDRIARARSLFAGSWSGSLADRRPASPGADTPPAPAPSARVSHHPNHLDRRTAMSTRPVANHHPHHEAAR